MNTERVVFGLVAAVTWLVCANTAEAKPQSCTLFCPEGQVLNKSACRCDPSNVLVTRTRECPLLNCLTTSPPCLAYRRNPSTGCTTCDCLFRCPARKCPSKCSGGVEYFTDQYGCQSCRCKLPPQCGNATCSLYCAEGYQQDQNECVLCKCKPCGDLCEIFCQHGKLEDFDGCQICECKLKATCGPICSNVTCEHGRVLDDQGCPTCQCVSKRPCGPICPRACDFGNVYDKYGCPTCDCVPEPNLY